MAVLEKVDTPVIVEWDRGVTKGSGNFEFRLAGCMGCPQQKGMYVLYVCTYMKEIGKRLTYGSRNDPRETLDDVREREI